MEIFLPTVHTFENDNIFTGSCGLLRFRVCPNIVKKGKEVDLEQSSMRCEFWHGEKCYELSEMEGAREYPISESGRAEMKQWLEENYSL